MRIYVLTIGAIASIISTVAFANQVITSQTYVDNADALKQDKITAGTTGNVVLYNGTQNGQTQFTGRAIYDGSTTYNSSTDANKLITAGAVNTMAPELPTGEPDYVVTYDENGDIGGERGIYNLTSKYEYQEYEYNASTDADKLVTASTLRYLPEARLASRRCTSYVDNAPQADENCLLWELAEVPVRAWQCETDYDCRGYSRHCAVAECYKGECMCGE